MAAEDHQPPWRLRQPTPRAAQALARELKLPLWAAQVLCHRGYSHPQEAQAFLNPSLQQLPHYRDLQGMDPALSLLVPAVTQGRVIGVAGDYDADGVTATALMVHFLRRCGAQVVWELPHRQEDGYGFSPAVARRLIQAGAQVVVTVDCGVSDHDGVRTAAEAGVPVVVTDHHQIPPGPLVPAAAVIDPQQDGCPFCPHLAGVGVAFYLAAGLRAALRDEGWFAQRPLPNLRRSLDLVALGTSADVVPLLECNRVLVGEGLKVLAEGRRPGLQALCRTARLRPPFDVRDLSFGLAPRLNAPGRMDHPKTALELLLCPEPHQAQALAAALERLNQARRELENQILNQALEQIRRDPELQKAPCLVLAREGWHQGVLGIVASRLVEATGRPCMLLSLEDGRAVGSGRSVEGFHLQRALASLAHLLTSYGGHALAAGASLPRRAVDELARGLARAAAQALPPEAGPPPLELETRLTLAELGPSSQEALRALAPFGPGHPEPRLWITGAKVVRARSLRDQHLKLELTPADRPGPTIAAIAFKQAHRLPQPGTTLELAATARLSSFGSPHLELVIEDMA